MPADAAVDPPKNTPDIAPTELPENAASVDVAAGTELAGATPSRGDAWLGRVLDERYRITERLGEGGMGAVFVAEHLKLRKQVALKMIRAELAGNGEVAARFAREAMATAQFEHPHVASAIDYGTLPEGGAYLVMQLVRGRSLRDVLHERRQLPWLEACELLAQVADALSAARGAGIVHRDLKPENILVETREDGSQLAKILDFGIAHVAPTPHGPAPTRELTRIGTVMGTVGYMSPEQAVGDKVDHRTDLYALGVVLWECISGQPLWDGPDITSIIARQMRGDVPRLRLVAPELGVPRELDDLIQQLCARAAAARPEHAGAVRDQLRALSHARGLTARGTRELYVVMARARGWLRALPRRTRLVAALAACAILLGTLSLLRASDDGSTSAASNGGPSAPGADGLVHKAMQAARGMIGEGKSSRPAIPPELAGDVKTMRESPRSSERRKAASRVLAYQGPVSLPAWVAAIAKLEEARTCRERRDAIALLVSLGDKRGLPAVRRLNDAGKTGCGFLNLEDCYGCIRGELRRAVTSLQASGSEAK